MDRCIPIRVSTIGRPRRTIAGREGAAFAAWKWWGGRDRGGLLQTAESHDAADGFF